MLSFAPETVNDELLFSYVSRWFVRSGYETVEAFNKAAFGAQIVHDVLNAHRFAHLRWSGGLVLDQSQVADKMTLIPLARLFLGEQDYFEFIEPGDDFRRAAKSRVPLLRQPWRLSGLRYCEHCVREHERLIGRGAWLRSHNLPGVSACSIHGVRLHGRPLRRGRLEVVPRLTSSVQSCAASLEEVRYAEIMAALLKWRGPVIHFAQWEAALHAQLARFGRGAVRRTAVEKEFGEAYGSDFLARAGLTAINMWRSPLEKLLDFRVRATHPAFTVLLAELVCRGGINELIEIALAHKVIPLTRKGLENQQAGVA